MLPQGFTSLALTLLLSSGVSGHVPLEGRQDSIREPEIQSSTPTTPPTASPIFPTPLASDTPSKPSSATNGTRFVLQVEYIQDSSRKPTIPEQDRVYLTGREEGAGFFEDGRAEFQFFTLPSWALEFELTKDGNLEFGEPQRTVIADLGRHKLVALTSKVAAPTEAISQWKFDAYDNLLASDEREPQWRSCRSTQEDHVARRVPDILLAGGDDSNYTCQNIHLRRVRSPTQPTDNWVAYPREWSPSDLPPARNRTS